MLSVATISPSLRDTTRAAVHQGTNCGYDSISLISSYMRAGDSEMSAERFTSRMALNLK